MGELLSSTLYAWHCIVLSSHYNIVHVQKHNNENEAKQLEI